MGIDVRDNSLWIADDMKYRIVRMEATTGKYQGEINLLVDLT